MDRTRCDLGTFRRRGSYTACDGAGTVFGGGGDRPGGSCEVEFEHEMSVMRIHEDPRVTLPYTDDQWKRIEALGYEVDATIEAGDIRLTMGGEPTFVSIDNMEGAEWNYDALSAEKRMLAERLIDRIVTFCTGA